MAAFTKLLTDGSESLSHAARDVLAALEKERALFFADLARAAKRLPSETEDALWELVAAGLVTADGFENLRALIDPKRRRGEGRGRHSSSASFGRPVGASDSGRRSRSSEKWAEQLLSRWGVLLRDLLAREAGAPAWRDLLPGVAANGGARADSRRPVRRGIYGRAVCPPGSARSVARGTACG